MTNQEEKRIHDIKAALNTFTLCIEGLVDGYKFDDNMAQAKIKSLEKALKTLKEEFKHLY